MGIIGAVASLVKTGIDLLLKLLTHSTSTLYLQVTTFITHGHNTTTGGLDILFSLLSDALIGSALGVVAAYVYRSSPRRFWIVMAVYMGAFLWLGSLTLGNLLKILDSAQTTGANLTAHLLSQLAFALLVYWGALFAVPPEDEE